MSLWDAVIGQDAATGLLRRAVGRDEISHAWLFTGPPGVGQLEAARALSADLNCREVEPGEVACGTCSTCSRIARGEHPAALDLEPEGAWHVVDAVRERWIPMATRTLVEGRRRVLRVVAADRMNEAAQNAFLKILEEPPASVVWILDVQDEDALLDTIVSRCRRIVFSPLGHDALAERARGFGVEGEALVRAAMGDPDRLRDLSDADVRDLVSTRRADRDARGAAKPTDEELADQERELSVAGARQRALGLVGRLRRDGPGVVVSEVADVSSWAKARTDVRKNRNDQELERLEGAFGGEWPAGVKGRFEKRFERLERQEKQRALELFLDDLGSYLRDLIAVASGAGEQAVVNVDHLDRLRDDAAEVPVHVAIAGLEAVAECREALERNGQPDLQLERLLLRLGVAVYRATEVG